MKISEVSVTVGSTFNVPNEPFSNFKLAVVIGAQLHDDEIASEAVKNLQHQAQTLVNEHRELLEAAARARAEERKRKKQEQKAKAASTEAA